MNQFHPFSLKKMKERVRKVKKSSELIDLLSDCVKWMCQGKLGNHTNQFLQPRRACFRVKYKINVE